MKQTNKCNFKIFKAIKVTFKSKTEFNVLTIFAKFQINLVLTVNI